MKNHKLRLIAHTIRALSMDMVQKANSGHPGLPLGMADVAAVLFQEFLRFNPGNPQWQNRDRFVLSGGHGSAMLYALLHLYGYDLSMEDLKNFRQWESKTPGHPEYNHTPGVETTTGPLGQGVANAVGMAIAAAHLSARFNKEGYPLIAHKTYVMAGDGDLQEGISHEALSLAGHLKLKDLILLYDSNDITIDGSTSLSDSTKVKKRFESYGWKVLKTSGHDYDSIRKALKKAQKSDKPVLIVCRTVIGFGSPGKAGTSAVHGSPLGEEEVLLTKRNLGISEKEFFVPDEVYKWTEKRKKKGEKLEKQWKELYQSYTGAFPGMTKEWDATFDMPEFSVPEAFPPGNEMATRKASGKVLEQILPAVPALFGGSADLTPSNNTLTPLHTGFSADYYQGNYLHYGVREFAMGAIMNGLALYGGVIPYGGTFFVFSDYMRPAVRMAALMQLQVVYVFTHDSVGLGEDGPTHQPVEHLAALRAIPGLVTFRPMDANETLTGWKIALQRKEGPTALVLSRQKLPVVDRNELNSCENAAKGAYILTEDEDFDMILMASGSEVHLLLEAKKKLNGKNIKVRVVSMPSMELFEAAGSDYRESILPAHITRRFAVEAGIAMPWYRYVGQEGKILSLEHFGASAPGDILFGEYGFTVEKIVETVIS